MFVYEICLIKVCFSSVLQLHFLFLHPYFFICTALASADQCLHSFQVNLGSVLDMAASLHASFLSVSLTQGRRRRDLEGERKEQEGGEDYEDELDFKRVEECRRKAKNKNV